MTLAFERAGFKMKRERGHLKTVLRWLEDNPGSQMAPHTYRDIAVGTGLPEEKVRTSVNNAYTRTGWYPRLRRTASAVNPRGYDYWWAEEVVEHTLEATLARLAKAREELDACINELVGFAQKQGLPADVRDVLARLLL